MELQFDNMVSDVRSRIARVFFFFFKLAGIQPENKSDTGSRAELRKTREIELEI